MRNISSRRGAGFTMLEILLVIVIIANLAGDLAARLAGRRQEA